MNSEFAEIRNREIGIVRSRNFSRRLTASEIVVKQPNLEKKLNGHNGCVNAVEFNSTGDLLVSGSDDRNVILWDWARNSMRFSYPSGHQDNIFQTKIVPFTDDRKIVTSAADGKVYSGHRNSATVRGVNFLGPNAEYVVSGSDCGRIYIWKKKGAVLVKLMVGDRNVVNHIEPHPHLPILATCGIENNVKIWTPMACDVPPLPRDIEQIMESNRQGREDHSRVTLTPDVIMHVLRLQRRQASAFTERRDGATDIDSDEENEWEAYNLEVLDDHASFLEDSTEYSPDCNIS